MIRRSTAIVGVSLATFALVACASTSSSFAGAWGTEEAGQPSLTIAADGSFNGTDGCNSLMGKGTIADDKFEFGDFATTLKACEGVDDWLSNASSATLSGDTLKILSSDGVEIGTLAKR